MKSSFSPIAVVILIAGAVLLFSLSILLSVFEKPDAVLGNRFGPGGFSKSAIGHAGLYSLLVRQDWHVRRSVDRVLAKLGANGTLVVAEPDLTRLASDDEMKLVRARRILLVLPKWRGTSDPGHSGWIDEVKLIPPMTARSVLGLVTQSNTIRYAHSDDFAPESTFTAVPKIDGMVQLMQSDELIPLIGDEDGMLLGEVRHHNRRIWVLSDPDLLNNQGLGKGDNAQLALEIMQRLTEWNNNDPQAPVIFDETVHGFHQAEGTPLELLFRFPFVIVTILICASGLLLILAGTGRFGAARPPSPALNFGKANLIGNSARLLDYSGHQATVLRRYVGMTLRIAGQALHAPPGMKTTELAQWMDRIGKARGLTTSCTAILRRARQAADDDRDVLGVLHACANDIFLWKGAIIHGSGTDRPHSR